MPTTSTAPVTPTTTPATVLNALHWRYATKVFDASKKLTTHQWETLQQALILSPSSYGLQPWRFIVVQDPTTRAELQKVSWNQPQVTQASHHIVFAARTQMTTADIDAYVQATVTARGIPASSLEQYKQMMIGDIVSGPRSQDAFGWAARQCYLALGNLLTTAALLGIDACPMEGIDPVAYDKILGLEGTGYRTVVACPVGFRSAQDKYAHLPKVRYSAQQLVVTK